MTLPSVELLYGAPAVSDVRLSPDGTRLAYLAPVGGVPNLWVSDLEGTHARPLTSSARALTAPRWTSDGSALLFLWDGDGDELHHLWSVDADSGEMRDLTPYQGVQAQLVGLSAARPREAAVALNLVDPARHDLYTLSLEDGALSEPLGEGAQRYAVDASLRLRFTLRLQPDGSAELHGPRGLLDVLDPAATVPLVLGQVAVSHDGSAAFCLHSKGSDTVGCVRYDLESGRSSVVHRNAEVDVAGFSTSPLTGEVDMVAVDGYRRTWHGTDRLASEDSDVEDVYRSADDAVWLVRRVRDDGPATWGLPERVLLSERPELGRYQLGRTEELSFVARDGRRIGGYVTRCPGEVPAPAVVWVHGGPWSRDRWGFDPIVQLLATRGYVVVQVNYRGSTGYGQAHLGAGDREWGARMQTDLSDAVDHLVAAGVVDPARVAIAGGSYGGYATLMGLVTEPDRYACGMAWCAPSNLLTLLRSFPPYWASLLAVWHQRVGHPERDAELLWERSPLAHLDRLRAPLLLVHGANDPRVLAAESRAVAEVLGERCTYHEVPGEGHGFSTPENKVWFLREVEAFLAQHLPVRAP